MIYALLTAFIVESVAFIVFLDRLTSRHAREVSHLCQRLQDPVAAVAQHVTQEAPAQYGDAHLPFDDDAAWLKYTTISSDDLG